MTPAAELSACAIVKNVQSRNVSALAVLDAFLEKVKKEDIKVKAFLSLNEDQARFAAESVDEKISKGEPAGDLAGVPIAVKDNICVQGLNATCASKILENFISPYDATVIAKLRSQGALIIGKTNMDEFAMGSSTENSAFQTTCNPWDQNRVPGGSSGGSAAAVAGGMSPLALGSDTGGSIRQPASFCGVVGLKPTYGRVSRYGLVAFASSLDQIGPFSRTAEDCALLLQAICGQDPMDSTSSPLPVPNFREEMKRPMEGLRIGLPREYFGDGLDSEVRKLIMAAVETFKVQGAQVGEISLPHTDLAVPVYYILAPSEASANLARFDGVRYGHRSPGAKNLLEMVEKSRSEGFGPEVKRRIMLGTYALSSGYYDAYYAQAQKVRTLISEDFTRAFKEVDMILTPTAPTPAFRSGEKNADPVQMYLSDIYTISCNLAGIPGISIPCGFSQNKLPVGLQILAKPFAESTLLQAAYAYQKNTNWHLQVP